MPVGAPGRGLSCPGGAYLSVPYISVVPKTLLEPLIRIQVYAGDGLWSYQEDYYSWEGMQRVRADYERLCAEHDPDHPRRRTRLRWPSSPDWAIGLDKHPNGL